MSVNFCVGDKVDVHFARGQSLFRVTVAYTPCAIGDAWVFTRHGKRYNVQQYEMICDPESTNPQQGGDDGN